MPAMKEKAKQLDNDIIVNQCSQSAHNRGPHMSFLKFYSQFRRYRFEDSEKSFQLFIQDYQVKKTIQSRSWLSMSGEGLLYLYSSYECEHFLDILHRQITAQHEAYNVRRQKQSFGEPLY